MQATPIDHPAPHDEAWDTHQAGSIAIQASFMRWPAICERLGLGLQVAHSFPVQAMLNIVKTPFGNPAQHAMPALVSELVLQLYVGDKGLKAWLRPARLPIIHQHSFCTTVFHVTHMLCYTIRMMAAC